MKVLWTVSLLFATSVRLGGLTVIRNSTSSAQSSLSPQTSDRKAFESFDVFSEINRTVSPGKDNSTVPRGLTQTGSNCNSSSGFLTTTSQKQSHFKDLNSTQVFNDNLNNNSRNENSANISSPEETKIKTTEEKSYSNVVNNTNIKTTEEKSYSNVVNNTNIKTSEEKSDSNVGNNTNIKTSEEKSDSNVGNNTQVKTSEKRFESNIVNNTHIKTTEEKSNSKVVENATTTVISNIQAVQKEPFTSTSLLPSTSKTKSLKRTTLPTTPDGKQSLVYKYNGGHSDRTLSDEGKKSMPDPKGNHSSKHTDTVAKHFKGFVQNVWLANPTHRPQSPIDEGPFGSILWRDKKYLVSVLIPIAVGFAGAMLIIVMAYASRAWRKRKERALESGNPCSFLEAATSKNDDTAPLQESSDDEF